MNRELVHSCEHVWHFKDVQFRDEGTDITSECARCGAVLFQPNMIENRPPLP